VLNLDSVETVQSLNAVEFKLRHISNNNLPQQTSIAHRTNTTTDKNSHQTRHWTANKTLLIKLTCDFVVPSNDSTNYPVQSIQGNFLQLSLHRGYKPGCPKAKGAQKEVK